MYTSHVGLVQGTLQIIQHIYQSLLEDARSPSGGTKKPDEACRGLHRASRELRRECEELYELIAQLHSLQDSIRELEELYGHIPISGPREDFSLKARRGLRGLVGGKEMSALPDSGADHNIITATLAGQMCLKIEDSPADFGLGNSKPLRSLGEQKYWD